MSPTAVQPARCSAAVAVQPSRSVAGHGRSPAAWLGAAAGWLLQPSTLKVCAISAMNNTNKLACWWDYRLLEATISLLFHCLYLIFWFDFVFIIWLPQNSSIYLVSHGSILRGEILHYLHRKLYQELLNCVWFCSSFMQHVNCNINPLGYDVPLTYFYLDNICFLHFACLYLHVPCLLFDLIISSLFFSWVENG